MKWSQVEWVVRIANSSEVKIIADASFVDWYQCRDSELQENLIFRGCKWDLSLDRVA